MHDLVCHIERYQAPRIVTIGEDATCVISRVEYDHKTDRCVGFVLPVNKDELPLVDSFIAVSFKAIEKMFSENEIAKYAYVYMAQPVKEGIPAFCLACLGTNNKFTNETVLQRWKYVYKEYQKRNVHVLSFGGDGDSRVMKAMYTVTALKSSNLDLSFVSGLLKFEKIPSSWKAWFIINNPSVLACQVC